MLQYLRTRKRALLVYMADKQYGHIFSLGVTQQAGGAFAYLRYRPGGRLQGIGGDGLDGIHYKQLRLDFADMLKDIFERRLGDDITVVAQTPDAVGAHADLLRALFAGNVEDTSRFDGKDVLEHERGLADTGLAANKHHRAADEATAEHSVELLGGHMDTRLVACLDFADALGRRTLYDSALARRP